MIHHYSKVKVCSVTIAKNCFKSQTNQQNCEHLRYFRKYVYCVNYNQSELRSGHANYPQNHKLVITGMSWCFY